MVILSYLNTIILAILLLLESYFMYIYMQRITLFQFEAYFISILLFYFMDIL